MCHAWRVLRVARHVAQGTCIRDEVCWRHHLQDPFPSWHRRGHPVLKGADKLVRVDPEEDATDGFFIALFVRQGKQARRKQQAPVEQNGVPELLEQVKGRRKKRLKREG
jgi:hypothetical protein